MNEILHFILTGQIHFSLNLDVPAAFINKPRQVTDPTANKQAGINSVYYII